MSGRNKGEAQHVSTTESTLARLQAPLRLSREHHCTRTAAHQRRPRAAREAARGSKSYAPFARIKTYVPRHRSMLDASNAQDTGGSTPAARNEVVDRCKQDRREDDAMPGGAPGRYVGRARSARSAPISWPVTSVRAPPKTWPRSRYVGPQSPPCSVRKVAPIPGTDTKIMYSL